MKKKKINKKASKFPNIYRIITERGALILRKRMTIISMYVIVYLAMTVIIAYLAINFYQNFSTYQKVSSERIKIVSQINTWQSIIKKYKDFKDGYLQIAVLGYRLGDYNKARIYCDKALLLDPEYSDAIELNKVFGKVGLTYDLERWISSIVSFVIYLITLVVFLNQLGITSIVLYLIVGAILMLIVLTFIVGLKDVIPNLVAWFVIQRRGHIKEGSRVEVKEISGIVEKVGMMETEIRTESGDILYVPNSLFVKTKFWVRS